MEKKNKKIKMLVKPQNTHKIHKCHFTHTRIAIIPPPKKMKNSMVSQGCRETRILYIADGEVNWYHHYDKYFWSLQKIKVRETT